MGERGADPPAGEVTRLLAAARAGEREAIDRLVPLLYEELRDMARRQLGRELRSPTLRATALVHEAWVKLVGGERVEAADRSHFLAITARAMRQVLVDQARRRRAAKRGGEWERVTLAEGAGAVEVEAEEILALDRALDRLEPRQREVVELRFFGGMEEAEIAQRLGVSERTVRRDWVKARAWLYRELYPGDGPSRGREPPVE